MNAIPHRPSTHALERVRFFQRQLLTVDDMRDEQTYFLEKMRRHNRFLHGWGVACGCEVKPLADSDHPWMVRVCCGYLLTPQGDEVWMDECADIDLAVGPPQVDPCAPCPCPPGPAPSKKGEERTVYLAVRYLTCQTRPVRVHAAGCSCGDAGCEYSRLKDEYEFKLLDTLPASHVRAKGEQPEINPKLGSIDKVKWTGGAPPCPEAIDDPWVVLATIVLPAKPTDDVTSDRISYGERRLLMTAAHSFEVANGG